MTRHPDGVVEDQGRGRGDVRLQLVRDGVHLEALLPEQRRQRLVGLHHRRVVRALEVVGHDVLPQRLYDARPGLDADAQQPRQLVRHLEALGAVRQLDRHLYRHVLRAAPLHLEGVHGGVARLAAPGDAAVAARVLCRVQLHLHGLHEARHLVVVGGGGHGSGHAGRGGGAGDEGVVEQAAAHVHGPRGRRLLAALQGLRVALGVVVLVRVGVEYVHAQRAAHPLGLVHGLVDVHLLALQRAVQAPLQLVKLLE
mmetsp:Transcript_48235/g.92198  ORF Transcript_48235/g.92198 Transcript_48235/m.92198 type:complete len:254 (-) Transcript_48235:150-911(-)